MPYWIITAPKMPTGDMPQERLQGRIQKGRILLEAAGRLFEQGGMVLDQFFVSLRGPGNFGRRRMSQRNYLLGRPDAG